MKENTEKSNEIYQKSKNELDFDLDFNLNDMDNMHKNIQLRLYQNDIEIQNTDKNENSLVEKKQNLPVNGKESELSRVENLILLKNQLISEEKVTNKEKYQKSKIGVSLFILLVGLFSLWIPLYKTICESQGFSVKTSHTDYTFQNRKCKLLTLKHIIKILIISNLLIFFHYIIKLITHY